MDRMVSWFFLTLNATTNKQFNIQTSDEKRMPRRILSGIFAVTFFSVSRIFTITTITPLPEFDGATILDRDTNIEDRVVNRQKIYSASACNLVPAWGATGMDSGVNNTSCVAGRDVLFPNTTATSLTCQQDDKPALTERNHPGVTIALLYFSKPALLLRQLQVFATYPETVQTNLTIIIIDDGSPAGLRVSDYINLTTYDALFRLRLARITTEKDWNIGGARNLALDLVDTPRTLLLDLDIIVPWDATKAALSWPLFDSDSGNQLAHRFNRRRADGTENKHPAVCMIRTDAYWESGGCDEDFCGSYGFTDVHFWFRWKADKSRALVDHLDVYVEELEMLACDSTVLGDERAAECQSARSIQAKPNRNLKKNHALYKSKTQGRSCWSNKYLRFLWLYE